MNKIIITISELEQLKQKCIQEADEMAEIFQNEPDYEQEFAFEIENRNLKNCWVVK